MPGPELVVVAQPDDPVATGVCHALESRSLRATWYRPANLGRVDIDLTPGAFHVGGHEAGAVLWRVSPDMPLAEDFHESDRAFASAEIAAAWVAGLRAPGVTAVNRFDATSWYSGLRPQHWRGRLEAAGVAVTGMVVGVETLPGDWTWSPYTTGEATEPPAPKARAVMASACHAVTPLTSSAVVGGQIVAGPDTPGVRQTATLLESWGVTLAAVDADPAGRIHRVRVLPVFSPGVQARVTEALSRYLYDDCTARRS